MSEFVRDRDGDVWEWNEFDEMFHSDGLYCRTRDELTRDFGPLTPCAADGDSIGTTEAVRALVAGAFLDLAKRLEGGWADIPLGRDFVSPFARETADAVLRGDVQPAEAP